MHVRLGNSCSLSSTSVPGWIGSSQVKEIPLALRLTSSVGSSRSPEAQVMRDALALIEEEAPGLEVEGEMQGDAALSGSVLEGAFADARLEGKANLLIMPNVDAANISFGLLKVAVGNGVTVGPILLGMARPVHILEPAATVRRIVNMTALAAVDAGMPHMAE